MRELCTIGYEGASLGDFIETLRLAGVEHVVDVRELPQSRRAGFSKNILAANLKDAGLSYTHFKHLGDPKPGREAARRGDYQTFRAIFGKHIQSSEAKLALEQVGIIASEKRAVLMCFERDPRECHRAIVAGELQIAYNMQVRHLGVIAHANKCRGVSARAA